MTKITLNKIDVARNAAEAYKKKKLSAQGPRAECRYRDYTGRPCVIGASIHGNTANKWDDYGDIVGLYDNGMFITDDLQYLEELQAAHDHWAHMVSKYKDQRCVHNIGWNNADRQEEDFIRVLNLGLPEAERVSRNDSIPK